MVKLTLKHYPALYYSTYQAANPHVWPDYPGWSKWLASRYGARIAPDENGLIREVIFDDDRQATEFVLKYG